MPITGVIDVIIAALGRPLADERVSAVLALATGPLEVEIGDEAKPERIFKHDQIAEGFSAR